MAHRFASRPSTRLWRAWAANDCGFGSVAGLDIVVPSVTWAKFRSQAEGAKLASAYLWGSAA